MLSGNKLREEIGLYIQCHASSTRLHQHKRSIYILSEFDNGNSRCNNNNRLIIRNSSISNNKHNYDMNSSSDTQNNLTSQNNLNKNENKTVVTISQTSHCYILFFNGHITAETYSLT